ncbi:MAG: hypothetical protein AB1758_16505, partial [Candidatus Eremiobacterota bacterium]
MASARKQMQALLEGLRSEGTHDSKGFFTLNLTQARQKLKSYQLLDPYHYVCPLLVAAVRGGARTLRVELLPGILVMEFDGAPFTAEELEGLFSSLLIES